MSESFKKLIVFISVSIVIGLLYILFSKGIGTPPLPVPESAAVKEFKSKCDSLSEKKWDQAEYKELNALLVAMESDKIFTTSGAASIEEYLNVAYAKTLKDSCKSWLESSGNDGDKQLFSEMVMLAGKSECSKILSYEVQIMRAYFSALQIPGKIRNFIQSEYTLDRYNSLIAEINSTAKKAEFISFSSMNKIASTGVAELNDFKNYANEFEGLHDFFIKSGRVGKSVDYLKDLCPAKNNSKPYVYYYQILNSLVENLCETL